MEDREEQNRWDNIENWSEISNFVARELFTLLELYE